ncbi:MAG: 50S ribosomal protein L33 [Planctomycetota bacterium]|jgi:large subunit ribosomal protein L33
MREYVHLECSKCRSRNYRTSKQTGGGAPKLKLKKYCKHCRSHTQHAEKKK